MQVVSARRVVRVGEYVLQVSAKRVVRVSDSGMSVARWEANVSANSPPFPFPARANLGCALMPY